MDSRARKSVIFATMFLLTGMLLSWQLSKNIGPAPAKDQMREDREKTYWAQVLLDNPGYPKDLRQNTIALGWRVCAKLESNWHPTRVLGLISQPSGWEDKATKDQPTSWTEMKFWIRLEQGAAQHLCPAQAVKLENWPGQNLQADLEELRKPKK